MMEILLRQPYSFCQRGHRPNQEDARFPDTDQPQGTKPAFVVCDGVGGQEKGEIASRTVADAMGACMAGVDLSLPFTTEDFSKVLGEAYRQLDIQMNRISREMATTLTFVCFHAGGVLCAHMGDSRIYHIRPGVGILYQSEDHSLVNALVHSGNLTPEEAINHPKGNVITRCLGYAEPGEERPSATVYQIEDVEEGDYFFLCTDGVLHRVDDAELLAILSSEATDKEKMDRIARKSQDSSDNNTAYLIGVDKVLYDGQETEPTEMYQENQEKASVTVLLKNNIQTVQEVKPATGTEGWTFTGFLKRIFK